MEHDAGAASCVLSLENSNSTVELIVHINKVTIVESHLPSHTICNFDTLRALHHQPLLTGSIINLI